MKKTIITAFLICSASYQLYPSSEVGTRFGSEPASQPSRIRRGTSEVGTRFGIKSADKNTIAHAHRMTGATNPEAQAALKEGGPLGLAQYMIRKIADALDYNTDEMIHLVQSAISGHRTASLPPVRQVRKPVKSIREAAPTSRLRSEVGSRF